MQSAGCTSQNGVIDDESLVKTRTKTCSSYASAVPSYSVSQPEKRNCCHDYGHGMIRH